jgi:UDP-2-acetamido-3-amino-2,3-dideoxy-glucuronate N-acetyltransferase
MRQNIVVVGCGFWGKNLIRNFYELGVLYGICDFDKKKLEHFKKTFPGIICCDDFTVMLQDPDVDAVAIATPASTHYSLAKESLSAGKDALVEKPLSLKYQEGEELVSLAYKRGKILMVGHVLLYHPAITKLKTMIDGGELGRIYYIYSNRLNLGKFRTEENILWSFAPHDISVILFLLNEMPNRVSAMGGNFLNPDIADVTLTNLLFASGPISHIFVSWLHPYKEQKLVIIGEKKMILFDDLSPNDKLVFFEHKIDWIQRSPIPRPEKAKAIFIETKEPLRAECEHFLDCIRSRKPPLTDGNEGLQVLRILEACQLSLETNGKSIEINKDRNPKYFLHKTSEIDEPSEIGEGTKIWHFSHILKNCHIGRNCVLGQNVSVGPNVRIGNNVKIQNNVSVYEGVELEDDVFCGPSMVFTNVMNPRSHWPRKDEYKSTLVKQGASLGANSTIICGITIGSYAFVGAGAVVDKDVPAHALAYGVPARIRGWMCYCGTKLGLTSSRDSQEDAGCPRCGRRYNKTGLNVTEISKKA